VQAGTLSQLPPHYGVDFGVCEIFLAVWGEDVKKTFEIARFPMTNRKPEQSCSDPRDTRHMPVAATQEAHERAVQQAKIIDSVRSQQHDHYSMYLHDAHGFHAGLHSAAPLSKDFGTGFVNSAPQVSACQLPTLFAACHKSDWSIQGASGADCGAARDARVVARRACVARRSHVRLAEQGGSSARTSPGECVIEICKKKSLAYAERIGLMMVACHCMAKILSRMPRACDTFGCRRASPSTAPSPRTEVL
jgi:hypothetical protein